MDNFDLKKYLIENKVTRNSRMINEAKEDPFSFLDVFITPVNEHNPQLVAKVKSILDAYEISELEQGIDTFGEALIEYFEDYDQHWRGTPNGMANNLWDAKLLATVKAYKSGTTDIKKTVSQFRKVLSNPRHYEPKHSRMLNETEPEDYVINSAANSFPQLVKKYGLEAVKTAFEVIYENTFGYAYENEASEIEAHEYAEKEILRRIKDFKKHPVDLENLINDLMDTASMTETSRKPKHSRMMNEEKGIDKLTLGGKTYEVGSDDPNDDGTIITIEKHPKGYFIMGQSGDEGYGYGVDMEGSIVDEDEIMEMGEARKPKHSRMMKEDEKVEASPEAIKTYLTLLKDKFGHKLGQFIEDELYDSMNMGNYTLPEEWNDEEFSKWAKMDLEWNASEGGEEVIDSNFAEDLFKSNLKLYGVEDYL